MALGAAAADASDATAGDADAGDRLVPANQLPSPVDARMAADVAVAALLSASSAEAAAALPAALGGNVSRTLAVGDPGVTNTATSVATGNCARIVD